MKPCYGYTRVSTKKQGDGVSLETQENAITEYAVKNGLKITKWFVEQQSAAKAGRPQFNRMLRELRAGKAAGVIIYKIDRSARNFADWAKVGELADAGIDVFFASESLDFNSRGGRLSADIQAVIAADFIRNHRNNVREGQQTRLEQGHYPFKAPLGYLDNGRGQLKTIDPKRGPLVLHMFELYASGNFPFWSLADKMARLGLRNHFGKPVTKSNIEKILKNPFYIGLIKIVTTGKTYQGAHEPLVAASLFEAVKKVRADRDNKKETKHRFFYRGGLFKCGYCQTAMIGERQKGFVYYRCHTRDCATKGIREEALDAQVKSLLEQSAINDTDHQALLKSFSTVMKNLREDPEQGRAPMELDRIAERKRRLNEKLLDDVIDNAAYLSMKEALEIEEQKWREIAAKTDDTAHLQDTLFQFLEQAKNLCLTYELATADEKRQMLKTATSNRVVKLKSVELEPDNWLRSIGELREYAHCEQHGASSRTVSEVERLFEHMQEAV